MPTSHAPEPQIKRSSVSDAEIAHFSALAEDWWNPRGPMAPLHAMNPLRTEWVHRHVSSLTKETGRLTLLDIGCGAGLASEAYAKLGFDTLGLDASPAGIQAAEAHLTIHPLPSGAAPLRYRNGSAEDLIAEGTQFDIVNALEVIEHVNDPQDFMTMLATLTRPGGMVAVSTLNRTPRSFAVAKFGAEYLLRMLPVGTHDWKKFIRPHELAAMGRRAGLRLLDVAGMSYVPFRWRETRDTGINYIAMFCKD